MQHDASKTVRRKIGFISHTQTLAFLELLSGPKNNFCHYFSFNWNFGFNDFTFLKDTITVFIALTQHNIVLLQVYNMANLSVSWIRDKLNTSWS